MFANKIMIRAFKQSPEVHYVVPVYKYFMQMEKIGPKNLGQFAEIFFTEKKIISAQVTLLIRKKQKKY